MAVRTVEAAAAAAVDSDRDEAAAKNLLPINRVTNMVTTALRSCSYIISPTKDTYTTIRMKKMRLDNKMVRTYRRSRNGEQFDGDGTATEKPSPKTFPRVILPGLRRRKFRAHC